MTVRTINRDPFARANLAREAVPMQQRCCCKWCGAHRKGDMFLGPICKSLYRYGTRPDTIRSRINWHDGVFCSKGCHDAYHGS